MESGRTGSASPIRDHARSAVPPVRAGSRARVRDVPDGPSGRRERASSTRPRRHRRGRRRSRPGSAPIRTRERSMSEDLKPGRRSTSRERAMIAPMAASSPTPKGRTSTRPATSQADRAPAGTKPGQPEQGHERFARRGSRLDRPRPWRPRTASVRPGDARPRPAPAGPRRPAAGPWPGRGSSAPT